MSKSVPNNCLVLVADGRRATLFRAAVEGQKLSLREQRAVSPKDLLDEGPSGSRPEEQTPKQTDEATFAKQLGQLLNHLGLGGQIESLVIIADPQTLGQMRGLLHKTVQEALLISIPKDLTGHSANEIAEAITRELEAD